MHLLYNYPLTLHHMFRHQPEVSRAILLVALDITMEYPDVGSWAVPDSIRKSLQLGGLSYVDFPLSMYGLFVTMPFWRFEHFLFAVDNGYIDLVVALWEMEQEAEIKKGHNTRSTFIAVHLMYGFHALRLPEKRCMHIIQRMTEALWGRVGTVLLSTLSNSRGKEPSKPKITMICSDIKS